MPDMEVFAKIFADNYKLSLLNRSHYAIISLYDFKNTAKIQK